MFDTIRTLFLAVKIHLDMHLGSALGVLLVQEVGPGGPQRSLPTSTVL